MCNVWKECFNSDIMARVQAVQDTLAEMSGLSIAIVDKSGNHCTIPSNQPAKCFHIQMNNAELCKMAYQHAINEVERLCETVSIKCPKGYTVSIVPLGLNFEENLSMPQAYLIVGKILTGDPKQKVKDEKIISLIKYQQAVDTVGMVFDLLFSFAGTRTDAGLSVEGLVVASDHGIDSLTKREKEILRLIATGLSNMAIANTLFISDKTVKTHVTNILTKLNLANRTELALYAVQAAYKLK